MLNFMSTTIFQDVSKPYNVTIYISKRARRQGELVAATNNVRTMAVTGTHGPSRSKDVLLMLYSELGIHMRRDPRDHTRQGKTVLGRGIHHVLQRKRRREEEWTGRRGASSEIFNRTQRKAHASRST